MSTIEKDEMQPIKFIGRHKRAAVLIAVVTLALASAVGAYWTQGGTGTGTASTGTTASLTVNQNSIVTGLYPGGPAKTLSGNFDNPNASNIFVNAVTAVVQPGWTSPGDVNKPACTAADFVIGGAAPVNAEIVSGNSVGSWSGLTIALLNTGANQDNCKNVAVSIQYTAS